MQTQRPLLYSHDAAKLFGYMHTDRHTQTDRRTQTGVCKPLAALRRTVSVWKCVWKRGVCRGGAKKKTSREAAGLKMEEWKEAESQTKPSEDENHLHKPEITEPTWTAVWWWRKTGQSCTVIDHSGNKQHPSPVSTKTTICYIILASFPNPNNLNLSLRTDEWMNGWIYVTQTKGGGIERVAVDLRNNKYNN